MCCTWYKSTGFPAFTRVVGTHSSFRRSTSLPKKLCTSLQFIPISQVSEHARASTSQLSNQLIERRQSTHQGRRQQNLRASGPRHDRKRHRPSFPEVTDRWKEAYPKGICHQNRAQGTLSAKNHAIPNAESIPQPHQPTLGSELPIPE
jgi:hypothetical protein